MESYDMETSNSLPSLISMNHSLIPELIVAFIVNVKQEQHFTQGEWERIPSRPTVPRIIQVCQHWTKIADSEKNGEEYPHQVVEF